MKSLIDERVRLVEEKEAAQAAKDVRHEAELVEEADAAIAEKLGGLWDALKPHITKRHTSIKKNHLIYEIQADELELIGFEIRYRSGTRQEVALATHHRDGSRDTDEFLTDCRRAWLANRERHNREEASRLKGRLVNWEPMGPEEAAESLARLIELFPEDEAEWLRAHVTSQEVCIRALEREDEAARIEVLADEYHTEYGIWRVECAAITEINVAALQELQKELDGPFSVWRLKYGIVSTHDLGDHFADTGERFVTTPESDEYDYWMVYNAGGMARMKLRHVVSVGGPISFVPSDNPMGLQACFTYHYPDGKHRIYYNYAVITQNEIKDLVIAHVQPYPAVPELPEGLDREDVKRAERRAGEAGKK